MMSVTNLEDSEEPFLTLSQQIATSFLDIYLSEEKDAAFVSKSPAQQQKASLKEEKAGARGAGLQVDSEGDGGGYHVAIQVARRLARIGDEIDAKVKKELHQATAELFSTRSVFEIGVTQFQQLCHRVLVSCAGSLNGWQQTAVIFMGVGQVVGELRRENPQDQAQRERQVTGFAGQVMQDVGLDRWITRHGGMVQDRIGHLEDTDDAFVLVRENPVD